MIPKPVQRARRLIKKYGYERPDEIDLVDLLYAEGLYLKYETTNAYQGKIVFNKHTGIITLNLNLENEYQKRYVIAHEMGHFFNEKLEIRQKDGGQVRNDKLKGKESLESMAGRQVRVQSVEIVHEFKKDRYHYFVDANTKSIEDLIHEREANEFAVELLMPRSWVVEAVSGQQLAVSLLKEISKQFRVSLTAAALRYAALYKGAMAVVLSKEKKIEWMACNKNFTFGKLNKYEPVPLNSRTYDVYDNLMPNNYVRKKKIERIGYKQFLKEQDDYKLLLDETVTVHSSDWFEYTNGYLNEIDFAMTNYNSVLTLLWDK